jgi:hypothetical protein
MKDCLDSWMCIALWFIVFFIISGLFFLGTYIISSTK